jgi:hypothetical protein
MRIAGAVEIASGLSDAPEVTFQASMYELREYGLEALKAQNARRRLSELSQRQHRDLLAALIRLSPKYPKITDELLVYIEQLGQ